MADDPQTPASVSEDSKAAAGPLSALGGVNRHGQDGVWFRVSDSVKLALHRGNITTWFVDGRTDAIVNSGTSQMLAFGDLDGAIHYKAGPELKEAYSQIPEVRRGVRCPTGEARVTKGFCLPVSHVIHTVGPQYDQYVYGNQAVQLHRAYTNSLKAAIAEGIKYIAFPAISCGARRYPIDAAAAVSLSSIISAIKDGLEGIDEIHFVLLGQKTYFGWLAEAQKQFAKI